MKNIFQKRTSGYFRRLFIRHLSIVIIIISLQVIFNINVSAQITIINEGTANPTLLYKGKPMLKFGPLPETAIFSVKWGTKGFPHIEWLNWMEQNKLGYGRVYPESGLTIGGPTDTEISPDDKNRLYPFKIAYWKEGRPVFDITQFSPEYWDNFTRVITECARRGIVLQMQLYQRVYFSGAGSWQSNYYNPENNINKISFPERKGGYGLFTAMMTNPVWKELHTKWVEQILAGIGKNGNVIIDLMNEGSFLDAGLTKEWVEYTLDIIEKWEMENEVSILTGFDFDHIFKKNDPNLEYILSHPRMKVLISEGSEGHVAPELVAGDRKPQTISLAIEYREKYRKPVISTNSPAYSVTEDTWKLHLYQWYSMMVKVQAAGIYAKEFPLDFSNPRVMEYANNSRYLAEFFEKITDYGKLDLAPGIISKAPGKYQLALASKDEVVIYLHAGSMSDKINAGEMLILKDFNLPGVKHVRITIFHPSSGDSVVYKSKVKNKSLSVKLPEFQNDIAVLIN